MATPSATSMTSLLGQAFPDEMNWSFLGRLRARYPSLDLEEVLGALPSYRKAFPTSLRRLVDSLGYVGAPDLSTLIEQHTFFRFALPEITRGSAQRLWQSLAESTFPSRAPHDLIHSTEFQLRICPDCLAANLGAFGVGYLHRLHQPPRVRICHIHGIPLRATRLTSGQREFQSLTVAAKRSRELVVGNPVAAHAVALAYHTLAVRSEHVFREQIILVLMRLLTERGLFDGKQVGPALIERLAATFDNATVHEFCITKDATRLSSWLTVPKLALVCAALEMPFDDLLSLAGREDCESTRGETTEFQRGLEEKVRRLAPVVAEKLKQDTRQRVSPWVLANALNDLLGAGFAGNHSWKPSIRAALLDYAETRNEFAARLAAAA